MLDETSRLRGIERLALALTALSIAVVILSASMRLDAAGLGCADWPACYGQLLAREPQVLEFGVMRMLHRIAATASLLLACLLVWRSLRPRPLRPVAFYSSLLLMLMLALSALGIWSSDPRLVLVGFLNIMGGLGLVSFSWRVVLACAGAQSAAAFGQPAAPPSRAMRLGVAGLSLTVVLGAWLGASYAAVACTSFPACDGRWWPKADVLPALNPFVRLVAAPMPGDPGGVMLHLLHRYSAVGTFLLLGGAAIQALRLEATRTAARVLLALLVVELCLGALAVLSGLKLWLVVSHDVCTAALLATVATLLRR